MPTKILAIDDSKTMRLAIKITFAAEDAEVTSVSKGSDAVARIKAKQGGYDVVLVDAGLADGEPSGYEVCRAIKQDPATAKIPVVLLVNNQTGADEAQLSAVGGDGWIAKPFETQALIDKVIEVLGRPAAQPGAVAAAAAAVAAPAAAAPAVVAAAAAPRAARAVNRTQMGMPAPAVAAPAPKATPAPPTPAVAAPAAPARPVAATPVPRPTVGAPPVRSTAPAAPAPSPAVAAAAPSRPAAATPAPRPSAAAARPAAAPARPVAAATRASGDDELIPIAIPIPFTAADSPTPGMVARLQAAAGAGGVDPKVAELLASLSREVIERIVWEVVPDLAEAIIRERQAQSA